MLRTVTSYKNQQPQINRQHIRVNYKQYIAHSDEPDTRVVDFIEPEIEEELMQNRSFLKHRVWKNAKRLRRPSSDLF